MRQKVSTGADCGSQSLELSHQLLEALSAGLKPIKSMEQVLIISQLNMDLFFAC